MKLLWYSCPQTLKMLRFNMELNEGMGRGNCSDVNPGFLLGSSVIFFYPLQGFQFLLVHPQKSLWADKEWDVWIKIKKKTQIYYITFPYPYFFSLHILVSPFHPQLHLLHNTVMSVNSHPSLGMDPEDISVKLIVTVCFCQWMCECKLLRVSLICSTHIYSHSDTHRVINGL